MKVCPHCGKQYPDSMTLCSADATALRSTDDPLLDETLAGKYLIEQLIKRGGMGAVYRGKHVLMDKTVAIKVLRPSLAADHEVVARFSREAKAASRISHPHAVSVTDFGEAENGVVFLVMEYLDGRTLKDIIRSEGPMPLARATEIMRQVAGALDAAHAEGVIHRDLKSDNIMLVKHDGGDWVKVLDFGIAKIKQPDGARDADLTSPDLIIGTPQYMSPEQCAGSNAIDARADVYSLGVILFEMLAGKVPFTGESPTVIMMKQVQEPPPSLLAERPDLPIGTGEVVARALAKRPEDRFQSAGELSAALSRAAGEETGAGRATMGSTGRIGVHALPDDLDETTLVQQRPPPPRLQLRGSCQARAGALQSMANHCPLDCRPAPDFLDCVSFHAQFGTAAKPIAVAESAALVGRSEQPARATCRSANRRKRAGNSNKCHRHADKCECERKRKVSVSGEQFQR